MIRLAIAGVGKVATVCARALEQVDGIKLVAAYNHTRMRLQEFCQNHNLNGYLDMEEMIKNERIDAILICTPIGTHIAYMEMAANQNCHILCQAPFTTDLAALDEFTASLHSQQYLISELDYHFDSRYLMPLRDYIFNQDNSDSIEINLRYNDKSTLYLMLLSLHHVLADSDFEYKANELVVKTAHHSLIIKAQLSTQSYFAYGDQCLSYSDVLYDCEDITGNLDLRFLNQKELNDIIASYRFLFSSLDKFLHSNIFDRKRLDRARSILNFCAQQD